MLELEVWMGFFNPEVVAYKNKLFKIIFAKHRLLLNLES